MERGCRSTETGRNAIFPSFLREPIQHQPSLQHTREKGARAARDSRPSDPIARRHEGARTQRPVRAARMGFFSHLTRLLELL
jgi:hypothetical protein